MKKLISTLGMTIEDWLEWRRKGLGGSDIAAALGKSRWQNPVEVYLLKTNQAEYKDLSTNEYVEWGKRLEFMIAAKFAESHPELRVQRMNFIIQHDEHEFMIANIDREIFDTKNGKRGILECKNTNAYTGVKEWKDGEAQLEYLYQGFHYMAVTGYDFLYYAVLIGGNKYIEYRIDRDDEIIKQLIEDELEFWQRVVNKEPPLVDGSAASTNYIKSRYPESKEDTEIELPDDNYDNLIKRRDLLIESKKIELEIAEIENRIKDEIKDNEKAVCKDVLITWRKDADGEMVDSKKLKDEAPELFAKYSKVRKGARKFIVKYLDSE
uniref:Putative exonuclease n=1 Tax=viral metagenome TaxID=1070528 RepID=A0A6H1ZIR8_9ZZZZ